MADNSQVSTGQGRPGWPARWISDSMNILFAAGPMELEPAARLYVVRSCPKGALVKSAATVFYIHK